MDSGEFINSGCNLDYKFSFIKEIVDGLQIILTLQIYQLINMVMEQGLLILMK